VVIADTSETHDGLAGREGAFVMCAFWLADGLAHTGELEEAQQRFGALRRSGRSADASNPGPRGVDAVVG
jgi:GH15 family glucan-1,4-alpha-glucosidase